MDIELQKRVSEAMAAVSRLSPEELDMHNMDPVAKMMLVALVNEAQKIHDYIDNTSQRLIERFCSTFIPRQKVEAMPAICVLRPELKARYDNAMASIGSGATFTYKCDDTKTPLTYIPIFNTSLLPHSGLYLLNKDSLRHGTETIPVDMERPNVLWVGIKTKAEVDSLQGLSMLIRGTNGIAPQRISITTTTAQELDFATMLEMESIEMADPFDAQQASDTFFSLIDNWKTCLLNMDDAALVYITDRTHDRDLFKPRQYPKAFQQWLESDILDYFDAGTIWLRLEFPEGYVVPGDCNVVLGAVPVTNIDTNSLMLTQNQPIAKLQKGDDSFFLRILETSVASQRQGFNITGDDIIIRDFDAQCYDNGALYRDVRNLYNRFIDDYYAFIEYNGIKDGEVLKMLRETINKLGKSVGTQNQQFMFDSGTYVMMNMAQAASISTIRVNYITTMGRIGNKPRTGEEMENKREPALEQKCEVLVSGMGGADKATADQRYELLRYYALTDDRLYTKMDIDAFLRKEMLAEFGREEFRRIFVKMSIEGADGKDFLRRGLYITIEFKDRKNYQHAADMAFDKLMQQRIINRSCIAMPIIVTMKNLEE